MERDIGNTAVIPAFLGQFYTHGLQGVMGMVFLWTRFRWGGTNTGSFLYRQN